LYILDSISFPVKEMLKMSKLEEFQKELKGYGDIALITPGTNFYYLTSLNPAITLERLLLLAVPVDGDAFIIAPALYKGELENAPLETIFWKDDENPYKILKEKMRELKVEKHVALVEDTMPARFLLNMISIFKDFSLAPLSPLISKFRMYKSDEEISYMKEAARIVDRVFEALLDENLRGMMEKKVAKRIVELIEEFGGDGISFEPIVASGPNGANPHHVPGEREIRDGDLVILDYGAKYKGYCSDMTRTIAVGNVSQEARKVFDIVKEANENAFQAVRAGVRAKDIDHAARSVIESYGYGIYFKVMLMQK
jgi:Xaa-Pro dipeptidase